MRVVLRTSGSIWGCLLIEICLYQGRFGKLSSSNGSPGKRIIWRRGLL